MTNAPKRGARRLGLALGAGGARGLAHIGVLRALDRAGIAVDAIAGTSIGAIVGAVYAAGQLENFEARVRGLEWPDVVRLFDPVWPRSGLLSGERTVEWLYGLLGDWRIEDLAVPFAAISVDLVTGTEVVFREGKVIDAVRASISIPGIFVPYRRGNQQLVDGALRNPVPVSALASLGANTQVAVNLHGQPVCELRPAAPRTASRPRSPIAARMSEAIESSLARLRKTPADPDGPEGPNLFEVLTASMTVLENELAKHRLAREAPDVLLQPEVGAIRSLEFHKAHDAIAAGEHEAERALPDIKKALRRRRLLAGPGRR